MSVQTLGSISRQTVREYGRLANHTVDACFRVAGRLANGVDNGVSTLLLRAPMAPRSPLRSRLYRARKSVSSTLGSGATRLRGDLHNLVNGAVTRTNVGLDTLSAMAGQLETRFAPAQAAVNAAGQMALPLVQLGCDFARRAADGSDRIAAKPAGKARKAGAARKTGARKAASRPVAATAAKAKTARKAPARKARAARTA